MTETPDQPASKPIKPVRTIEQDARAKRLASALRDNLRRRKAAHPAPAKPGN